jgi:N-glycosylase/DNA lyase
MIGEFGERAEFADGSKHCIFPSAKKLAKVNTHHFKKITRCGYRAKYILQAARLVRAGDLDLEEIARLNYPSARKALMEILGIGPKVADCFLLYGLGKTEAAPVDVWIHRVASGLFFPNVKVSRERVAAFLRAKYGSLAGYAQLYLFCLAREGPLREALEARAS